MISMKTKIQTSNSCTSICIIRMDDPITNEEAKLLKANEFLVRDITE